MKAENEEQYRVVRSQSRAYRSTLALKGLYTFNAVLVGLSLMTSLIPTILLLFRFINASSDSALQFIAGLGLAFFLPFSIYTLTALLINVSIIFLLSLGIRKDWPVLTGIISGLTVLGHIIVLSAIAGWILAIFTDNQTMNGLAIVAGFVRALIEANPAVVILVVFLQILITVYIVAFVFSATRGLTEAITKPTRSTLFTSGILVESARKSDVERLMEIYYAKRRIVEPEKSSYELWKKLMKKVDLEKDVRIARVDEDIVGFLITSENFKKVESVHLIGGSHSNEAEKCLLRDFVRLHSRSERYVDVVEVSGKDLKLQKALSQNGWEAIESESSPQRMKLRYVSEELEA